uniref:Uncharacterized protein n=1 Tax=Romanomermis culicivorax TaxID=13658 RepID=A0A915KWH2_ROMCU
MTSMNAEKRTMIGHQSQTGAKVRWAPSQDIQKKVITKQRAPNRTNFSSEMIEYCRTRRTMRRVAQFLPIERKRKIIVRSVNVRTKISRRTNAV